MTENQIKSLSIRLWRPNDLKGTWKVLRQACFSLLHPAFIIYTNKKSFQYFTVGLAGLTYLCTYSSAYFLIMILVLYAGVYILQLTGLLIYLYIPTSISIKDLHSVKNMQAAYFSSNTTGFWVAEVERIDGVREVAGTIAIAHCGKVDDCTDKSDRVRIRRMAVLKKYRGLGIAEQLVTTTIKFCRERNLKTIELYTTEVHNAARRLYAKLGFKLAPTKCKRHIVFRTISMSEYLFEYDLTA